MSGLSISGILDTRQLDELIKRTPDKVSETVRKFAFRVETEAKKNAPVLTGALRNSIYVTTMGYDGYQGGAVQLPGVPDRFTAFVGPSVEYGIYVEMGHHTRPGKNGKGGHFVPGQPFLYPAVNSLQGEWLAAWIDLI